MIFYRRYFILCILSILFSSKFSAIFGQDYFSISGITLPSAANGTYNYQGTYSGEKYWQNSSGYKVYRDNYGGREYWNIDIDLNDDNDVYFYVEDYTSTPPQSGYTSLSGTGNPAITFYPEINIQGNKVSIVDGDSTPSLSDHTDFGSANVAAQTVSRTYTIQNSGKAQLTISSIVISGTNSSDFSITSSPASTVGAESSTTFVVTFNPSTAGNLTAKITVNNSDADESIYDFNIMGAGNALITFTDGSSFTANIVGTTNQAIGRFILVADAVGANLSSSEIKLNGIRSGLSNFRLWISTDNGFNSISDTQLGSDVSSDPGVGSSIIFNGFSGVINTSNKYFFLTADVSGSATGSVAPIVVSNSKLSFTNASLSTTINNFALSSSGAVLPVELVSFAATINGNKVLLNWQTSTEVNNYGFEIARLRPEKDRDLADAGTQTEAWETIGFVNGHGNSNSPNDYSFADTVSVSGTIKYRLKQIDTDGNFEYSDIVEIVIDIPIEFKLAQNYPNPFNPTTIIKYSIPAVGDEYIRPTNKVTLKIYDLLGREVATLVNKEQTPGKYEVTFDAGQLASGTYIYRIVTGGFVAAKKLLLLK